MKYKFLLVMILFCTSIKAQKQSELYNTPDNPFRHGKPIFKYQTTNYINKSTTIDIIGTTLFAGMIYALQNKNANGSLKMGCFIGSIGFVSFPISLMSNAFRKKENRYRKRIKYPL